MMSKKDTLKLLDSVISSTKKSLKEDMKKRAINMKRPEYKTELIQEAKRYIDLYYRSSPRDRKTNKYSFVLHMIDYEKLLKETKIPKSRFNVNDYIREVKSKKRSIK